MRLPIGCQKILIIVRNRLVVDKTEFMGCATAAVYLVA